MVVALLSLSAMAGDAPVTVAAATPVNSQTSGAVQIASAGDANEATIVPALPVLIIKPVTIARPVPLQTRHRFFDLKNCAALAATGAALTGDALSTQKGLGLPGFHEVNPIARPFVQNRPGAAFYSAASFAFMAGGMYLAHKTNHHKLERILPLAIAGWEGLLTFHNYHLISTSTNTH